MPALRRKADTGLAQIGGGDPKVVAHPAFRDIPGCLFPLNTTEAQAQYDASARLLFDAGQLTASKHMALSSYASQFDSITLLARDGKPARASAFAQLDKARRELGLDDLDKPIAAPASAPTNAFARTGFPNRR